MWLLRNVQLTWMSKRFALFPVPLTPVDVIIGCATDSECPDYLSCINQACRDPCILSDPCAPNAFCKVIFHTPKCACPAGYLGDPQIECKLPRKNCFIDSIKNNWFYKNLKQLIIYLHLGISRNMVSMSIRITLGLVLCTGLVFKVLNKTRPSDPHLKNLKSLSFL